MKAWVDAQDSTKITLIGDPFAALRNPLSNREDLDAVTISYCTTVSGSVCTVPCTTTTSGTACINAPRTNCLFSTGQISFWNNANCVGNCTEFNSCANVLQNGFCSTPGLQSVGTPASP